MAQKKIGAYITLDGEKEFRNATSACNKSLAAMKSEMKLVEAQTAGNANTLDALKKKHEVLSKTLDEQVKKEEAVSDGLKHAQKDYERIGNELDDYKTKLEQAKNTLEEMRQSSDTTKESLDNQSKQVEELEKIVSKGEETYQRAGNRVNEWKKQLNNAEAQTIRATKALNENDAYMKEAEKSTDKHAKSIDGFGKKVDDTADRLTSFGTILKANVADAAIDFGKDTFKSAVQGALELEDAQRKLQASTGTTAQVTKEYSAEMEKAYSAGYGDQIEDVADAMALVKQYTNETDPSKIRELAENAMTLEDTFDMDLSESIKGADSLMKNMGLTAEEAFDYIAKGAQNGLNKSGELTDNLSEYSQIWEQAGFSAEEMFAILQNGIDSGAYNLDKVNDYVKEFGNSLADGRIEENISSFSGETQNLFYQWKAGEATTKQVFQSVISDLAGMENKQQALTIASNTWSSLGEDNAMKVITSLNNVNNTYKNVQGTMEQVKKIRYDSVANQWKSLGRTFQTDVVTPIIKEFLPAAKSGMEFLTDNIDGITAAAKVAAPAVMGIFAVKKGNEAVKLLQDTKENIKGVITWVTAHTVAKTTETAAETANTAAQTANTAATVAGTAATTAHSAVTTIATAAQTAFNAALLANPAAIALVGITALVGGIALLTGSVEEATTKTDELAEATDKSIEKTNSAAQSLGESTQGWSDALGELKAQEGVADNLITELYDLESQSGKTDAQIGRMNTIVGELNSMFPELSLSIDENTGALSANEQQTRRTIDTALQMSKAAAAQEQMAEIAGDLAEAEMAQYDAEQSLKDIGDELAELEQERTRITEESSEAVADGTQKYVEYNGKMMDAQEALMRISEQEETLKDKRDEQQEAMEGLNEKYEEANGQYQNAYEYVQSLTEGTSGNTDAVNKNTEALVANAGAIAAKAGASAAGIDTVNEEAFAYENLSTTQQQLAVDVTNGVLTMQENVQSALESQMNMFERFDGGVQLSTEELLSNMQSQIDGVTTWEQNLSTLADRGINEGLLQKLAEMGPEGAGYVQTFANMTDAELKEANSLWDESVDIKGMTNNWGQQLLESGAANIAGGMNNLTPILQASGANTVAGLVQGMQQAQASAQAAGTDLGVKTIDSINSGLGCASPSKKTTQSGLNTTQGLANGMNMGKVTVTVAAMGIATTVVKQIDSAITTAKFMSSGAKVPTGIANGMNTGKVTVMIAAMGLASTVATQISSSFTTSRYASVGRNAPAGLAAGIRSGRSQVISAASDVASAAIRAAKNKLEIRSPSHVFRGMGVNSMESYAMGVRDRQKTVESTVKSAVDFSDIRGTMGTTRGTAVNAEQWALSSIIAEAMKNIKLTAYLNDREVTRALSGMGVMFGA